MDKGISAITQNQIIEELVLNNDIVNPKKIKTAKS
jgi:hypothetical protein